MFGKYFFHKARPRFYQPGEEICLDRNSCWHESDSLSFVKGRIVLASIAFCLVYFTLAARLFDLCILKARETTSTVSWAQAPVDDFEDVLKHTQNSIKRADILDRNGTIVATSLPTVHLTAKPNKIRAKEELAAKLAEIIPDTTYETFLRRLQHKGNFVYLKRNLSPAQQYQINALGNPWLEFEESEKRVYPHKNLFSHMSCPAQLPQLSMPSIMGACMSV